MAVNYDVNYNDERFQQVESDKTAALSELEKTYAGMINSSDKYYQAQIDASKQWADKQTQLQQEQTDFAIEQIEYQKELAEKDYNKEQSASYVDWQKQSNQYGANAEQMAAQGLANSGYSESSQVSMYNTYQNRVATAREAYVRAVQNYDIAIKDARLQNNAALAEIAYNALQQQLELSLQGFQYKNQLILDKTSKKIEVDNMYYGRYQDVLQQINTENALAEEVRQYNENKALQQQQLELQKAQLAEEQRQFNETMAYNKAKSSGSSGGSSRAISGGSSSKSTVRNNTVGKSGSDIKGGSSPTVDMNSVLALGFGPISASKLNSLVASGVVQEYESNGKLKYKKSPSTLKQSMLLP